MTTRVNLLPWREMRRKEQDRMLLSIAIGAWMLMVLIVGFGYLHVGGLIDAQTARNEFLQQEIAKLDQQIKEIQNIKKQREALIARMQVIERLQGERTQIVHLFDDLARQIPEGVYLGSLKQEGKALTLAGTAQSNARVSSLMRNLDGSDWFTGPNLNVINVVARGGRRVSEFSLQVNQANKAKDKAGQ